MNKLFFAILIIFALALSGCNAEKNVDKELSDAYYNNAIDNTAQTVKDYNYTQEQSKLLLDLEKCKAEMLPSIVDDSLKLKFIEDLQNLGNSAAYENYEVARLTNNVAGMSLSNGLTRIDYECKSRIAPQLLP